MLQTTIWHGVPGSKAGDAADIGGKRMFVPSVWGTEAITFNTKTIDGTYGKIGLSDLFDDKYVGKVTCVPTRRSQPWAAFLTLLANCRSRSLTATRTKPR